MIVKGENNQIIYLKQNVYEEALNRIRYLFDEFENCVVGFSGGKDSTICLELSLKVAAEKNRLPLKVLFLDQEAEWQNTIDYVTEVMERKDVEPMWFQMPLKLFNATSHEQDWLECWKEGDDWIREKVPYSYKENKYNCDRFADLFTHIFRHEFPDQRSCYIAGVRCEESPTRRMTLTQDVTYKWITWGKYLNKKLDHFTFYPLYDWSVYDVWKAIHQNNWNYNKIYDYYYRYGRPIMDMRVSNVHHETAIQDLLFMQEIEKETWNKIVKRIQGANTLSHLKQSWKIKELPFMFDDWVEYRDYLLDKLVQNQEQKERFKHKFEYYDNAFAGTPVYEKGLRVCITAVLKNDYHHTVFNNFIKNPSVYKYNKLRKYKVKEYGYKRTNTEQTTTA